jgi:hypothetical protein
MLAHLNGVFFIKRWSQFIKLPELSVNIKLLSIFIIAVIACFRVHASTVDCQNLYIGRIWVEKVWG